MPEVRINGPAGRLEGRYTHNKSPNAPIALVLHPHPQHGGTMNNRVVYTLFQSFVTAGFSTLRINFRGVGRSQGKYDRGEGEMNDAASAVDWLQTYNPQASAIWIAGFSFGAFGGRAQIMDLMNPMRSDALPHAGTFNNNVYSMSVGAVGLKDVFTTEQSRRLFHEGEKLRDRLNKTAKAISPAVQFTGCGSVMNIHFVRGEISCPEDVAHESKDLMKLFHFDLLDAGVYAARRGQINLSLPMTQQDHDTIVTAVAGFLQRRKPLIDATI